MSKLGQRRDGSKVRRRPALEPRSLVVHLCCAALLAASGCTTMQTVESSAASGASQQVDAGDSVAVSLHDGRRLELSFVEWTADGLAGTDSDGTLHRIAEEDIAQLEVERHSLLGSIGVGVAVLGLVLVAASDASPY